MFVAVPPVCVLYWKVHGAVPETYNASGSNGLVAKLIPKPYKYSALVLKLKLAPFGDGVIPPFIKLIGVNISRSCANGDWTKSG